MGVKGDKARERTTGEATRVSETLFPESFEPSVTNSGEFVFDQLMKIRKDTKSTIYVQDSKGNNLVDPIRNFFLNSISIVRSDRVQLMETYGGLDVIALGELAVPITINATLMNTESHNWRDQWMTYWSKYLRVTQVAKRKSSTVITTDNMLINTIFMKYQMQETGDQQNSVGLQISAICDPSGIIPVKMQKTAVYKISKNLDNIAKSVLKSLENGQPNQYFANETGSADVFAGASSLAASGTVST